MGFNNRLSVSQTVAGQRLTPQASTRGVGDNNRHRVRNDVGTSSGVGGGRRRIWTESMRLHKAKQLFRHLLQHFCRKPGGARVLELVERHELYVIPDLDLAT